MSSTSPLFSLFFKAISNATSFFHFLIKCFCPSLYLCQNKVKTSLVFNDIMLEMSYTTVSNTQTISCFHTFSVLKPYILIFFPFTSKCFCFTHLPPFFTITGLNTTSRDFKKNHHALKLFFRLILLFFTKYYIKFQGRKRPHNVCTIA